jgi:predicted nucleic acid-binding protein
MKYLLDTDICIYIIKKKPPEVLQKFSALPGRGHRRTHLAQRQQQRQ